VGDPFEERLARERSASKVQEAKTAAAAQLRDADARAEAEQARKAARAASARARVLLPELASAISVLLANDTPTNEEALADVAPQDLSHHGVDLFGKAHAVAGGYFRRSYKVRGLLRWRPVLSGWVGKTSGMDVQITPQGRMTLNAGRSLTPEQAAAEGRLYWTERYYNDSQDQGTRDHEQDVDKLFDAILDLLANYIARR